MARVLCIWEFGDNVGHLINLKPSIDILLELNHEVFIVTRDLYALTKVFKNYPIKIIQSPIKKPSKIGRNAFLSSAQIILQQLLDDNSETYIKTWRTIFDLVSPELVLFESSPIALVSSIGYTFKKIIVGNGFGLPLLDHTLPFGIFPDTKRDESILELLYANDVELLSKLNTLIPKAYNIKSLFDLYHVDDIFLMSIPILDHYNHRNLQYLGGLITTEYSKPIWPMSDRPKIFVYLCNISSLERLLYCIKLKEYSALIYIKNCPPELKARYTSSHVIFLDEFVNLQEVSKSVTFVITNGNHNTTLNFILSGVPQLIIPNHQEHYYLGLRLKEFGNALLAYPDKSTYITELNLMDTRPRLKQKALELQSIYNDTKVNTSYIKNSFEKLLL